MARTKAAARRDGKLKGKGRVVTPENSNNGGKKKTKAEKKSVKAKSKAKFEKKQAKEKSKQEVASEPRVEDGFITLDMNTDEADVDSNRKSSQETHQLAMSEPAPWMQAVDKSSYNHANLYLALHDEILDFVQFMSPSDAEMKQRQELVDEMSTIVKALWPDATLETFGSHETQMFLPQSDVDLVVLDAPSGTKPLFALAEKLRERDLVSFMEVIDKARIPIVKFVHKATGFPVDVSFNVSGGLATADLVKHYMRLYPSFRPLTLVLKYFLAQRGVNETYTGGIGSFMLQMMIISFLQQYRRDLGKSHTDVRYNNLGILLVGFFTLYGRDFNYKDIGICVRNGGSYYHKNDRGWMDYSRPYLLSLENPMDTTHDIGTNSYDIRTIVRAFEFARRILDVEIRRRGQVKETQSGSILAAVLPPDEHLAGRDGPSSFGFDVLHHDPVKTLETRRRYEDRKRQEQSKKPDLNTLLTSRRNKRHRFFD